MYLLVLNAGSGTQRCSLFRVRDDDAWPEEPCDPIWEASLDATAPGQPAGRLWIKIVREGRPLEKTPLIDAASSPAEHVTNLIRRLWEGDEAPLPDANAIDAVGHRVVHGGEDFTTAVMINQGVEAAIERLADWAPLHNPVNLAGIRAARAALPEGVPHFAVFDTAFHHTLSAAASTYAGPYAWKERGIRRYGFHGTSIRWAAERAARLLGRANDPDLRLILCHLGGGCSLCATRGGRSLDTTMGFTPLDGIAMCTRTGTVDPGILIHLLRTGTGVDELEEMLNRHSGLKGLSGLPGDTRIILPRVAAGSARATLAWEVFVHRLRAGIGTMLASLGERPDAFVFTDVIGETVPQVRAAACAPFAFLGLHVDAEKNTASPVDADVADRASDVRVLVIKSREAWRIAQECHGKVARLFRSSLHGSPSG